MRVLNEEGERLRRQFDKDYGDSGCSCHLSPPCNYCIHPGNPANLDETDDVWMWEPDEEEPPKKEEEPKVDVMDVTRRMFR